MTRWHVIILKWTLNYGSLKNVYLGGRSLSLATLTPSALTSDLIVRPPDGDGHIGPLLIIFHWLVGCRLYHSWAQLLYLMVRVLDHSIHLNQVSFQIVFTED